MICAALCGATAIIIAVSAVGIGISTQTPEIVAISMLTNLGAYLWVHLTRLLSDEKPPVSGMTQRERRIVDGAPAVLYGLAVPMTYLANAEPVFTPAIAGLVVGATMCATLSTFHHANWRTPG